MKPVLQNKWQSTREEQGLKLHTQLVVQPDTEQAKVLESLLAERLRFACHRALLTELGELVSTC